MNLKYSFTLIIFIFFSFLATSQAIKKKPIPLVNYSENVETPFTTNELEMLKVIYKDKLEDYVLDNVNLGKALKHLLRNRILVKKIPQSQTIKKYKELPVIALDKEDTSLKKGGVFNKELFNPLKYKFDFFSKSTQMFRIDNTSYYLIIKSQH